MQSVELTSLEPHSWQRNIPNLTGKDWNIFFKDVSERGIQEPIAVSTRTGKPVIVDGHQRVRAAREVGLTHISAIVRPFADEGEEVMFLAGAARFRRHLSDFQRVDIGKAYEAYFRPKAKEAQRASGGDKKSEEAKESVTANLQQPISERASTTAAKAAETVGMSEHQYHKAKQVSEKAPEPFIQEWQQGNLSTSRPPTPLGGTRESAKTARAERLVSPVRATACLPSYR